MATDIISRLLTELDAIRDEYPGLVFRCPERHASQDTIIMAIVAATQRPAVLFACDGEAARKGEFIAQLHLALAGEAVFDVAFKREHPCAEHEPTEAQQLNKRTP